MELQRKISARKNTPRFRSGPQIPDHESLNGLNRIRIDRIRDSGWILKEMQQAESLISTDKTASISLGA